MACCSESVAPAPEVAVPRGAGDGPSVGMASAGTIGSVKLFDSVYLQELHLISNKEPWRR